MLPAVKVVKTDALLGHEYLTQRKKEGWLAMQPSLVFVVGQFEKTERR